MRRLTVSLVQVVATACGVLLLAGDASALSDPRDRGALQETINALMQIASPGRSMDWSNPATGNRGEVRVIKQANAGGQTCWDFRRSFPKDGKVYLIDGLACEIDVGLWSIVSEGAARLQGGSGTAKPSPPKPSPPKPAYDRAMMRDTQSLLTTLGYRPGPADGAYGPRTKGALQSYQRDRGLTADGIPSAQLVARLREEVAAQQPNPGPTPTPSPTPPPGPPIAPTPSGEASTAQIDAKDKDPWSSAEGDKGSIAGYCEAVLRQSTSTQGGVPSEVLPLQFCLVNAELSREKAADTSGGGDFCAAYDSERQPILDQARRSDIVAVSSYLRARYGATTVRAAHARNGETCVRQAHRKDDAEGAVYFALLMVGVGEAGFAELVAGHYALGFGVPGDLRIARDWMAVAKTALDNGKQPVVSHDGIDRRPVIQLMVDELEGKIGSGTAYAHPGPAGDPSTTSGADPGSNPASLPGGPSAQAVEIASELLSQQRDEIAKTYSSFEYLLGGEAGRVEQGCLADKSGLVKGHEDGSAPIEDIVAHSRTQSGGQTDQNLRLTTAFCRAVSYRANDPNAMFYYDYMNYALGKTDSAQNISYHYIVGNGVAANREKSFDWLTEAIKTSNDADARASIAKLLSVL